MNFQAPGKVVFWGEYAVLEGAPAAVMAVNRYAHVTLEALAQGWQFASLGLITPGIHKSTAKFSGAPTAVIAETILGQWGYSQLAGAFSLCSDSTHFFTTTSPEKSAQKLGIGSSAAICTATYLALATAFKKSPSFTEALTAHQQFQGGKGSGLDVAASWHGGFIEFQNAQARPLTWPANLYWRVIWTGASASTNAALNDFGAWQQTQNTETLTALGQASTKLCKDISLANLMAYSQCLRAFDEAAQLNIFTQDHRQLATIASAHGLTYKPCGAGGGDIGLVCGSDPQALEAFCTVAAKENYLPLNMETAPDGVQAC